MHTIVGQYNVSRRTVYSKIVIENELTGENISKTNSELADKIIEEYEAQKAHPEDYFEIDKNKLNGLTSMFFDETENKYVFIPEGIIMLSNYALESKLVDGVALPDTLEIIGAHALYDCRDLQYLYIPDSVKEIRANAFEGCLSLEKIRLPQYIEEVENELFYNCVSLLEVELPDSITRVGNRLFSRCIDLEKVKLPKDLSVISVGMFRECNSLKTITLPEKLIAIDEGAFVLCTSLEEMNIPSMVHSIGRRAFGDCQSLKKVTLPEGVYSLKEEIFLNCKKLEEIKLPNSITDMEGNIFANTERLLSINVPKNLIGIKNSPFAYSSIKSLKFNYDLKKLKVELPAGFEPYDLISNSNIDTLIIDSSVRIITPEAFFASGPQIKTIDYRGTEADFKIFKGYNEDLFKLFTNLERVNFKNSSIEDRYLESFLR